MTINKINRSEALKGIKKIKIKTSNFNIGYITIVISIIIISLSLTLPWISLDYNNMSYFAFSQIMGITGYVALLIIIMNLFIIFSVILKEKIKLLLNYFWKDCSVFIGSSIILILLGIQTLTSLKGLKIFSSDITFHSGIIFFLIGSILFFVGSIINKRLNKKIGETYITNNSNQDSSTYQQKEKNTTKLPF